MNGDFPEGFDRKALSDEALRGLDAIWRAAWREGHRTGFAAGVAEKAWLHRTWPGIGILLYAFGMAVGIFVGWSL